ncbi:MAG: thioredoxin domain-containing protein [Weeksellaceae bacterium]
MNRNIFIIAVLSIVFMMGYSIFAPSKSQSVKQAQKSEYPENYIPYSDVNFLQSRSSGRTLLYFHAPWCSTCTVLDDEIKVHGQADLPKDLTILKVDYDRNTELKKKYQVITQHTLVLVDEDGQEVKKWIGGDLDEIHRQLL